LISSFKQIVIFCDGACSGNPGPGGWGGVVAWPDGHIQELGGGSRSTTNNQMELVGAIESLRLAFSRAEHGQDGPPEALLCTDSTYVIRGITQWIWGWQKRGWTTAEGKDVLNKDLWIELQSEVRGRKIQWRYVRGHIGVPGNERVDAIAVEYSKGRRPVLFEGPLLHYGVPIHDLPPEEALPEMKPKPEKRAVYSYLSLLGSVPMRHKTWPECERRVKGQPGAKFKKAHSAEEENEILRSWGVDPSAVK